MGAAAVVVVRIRGQDATQMALVEDYDVVEALTANRTDHAFDVCVLPYMDPARLQEPLLFFEIPVAAIYSTSLNGRMLCSYRPEP